MTDLHAPAAIPLAPPTPDPAIGVRARRDDVVRLAAGTTLWLSLLLVVWWWLTGGGITDLGGWATGLTSLGPADRPRRRRAAARPGRC